MFTSSCWFWLLRGPGALLLILFNCLLFGRGSKAALVNRTIDDVFGDSETGQRPVFLPTTTGVWKDQTCSDCAIHPDINRAVHNTYTSATYNPQLGSVNVTMDFNGTAIYIFFILANNAGDGITTITNCTFKLDGQDVGSFLHVPDMTTTVDQFNTLVFSKTDIPFGEHRLVVATEDLTFNAYMNFDYALYTFEDQPLPSSTTTLPAPSSFSNSPQPSQPSSSSVPPKSDKVDKGFIAGAIAGSVIGGFACLAIIGILSWSCWRRKNIPPQINLLGPVDDVSGSKGGGLPIYHTNRPGARTGDTIPTFVMTGTTPFPSGRPSTTESPPPSRTGETPKYRADPRPQPTTLTTSLHVANPGPESPFQGRVKSMQQDVLKEQLVGLCEEHENLKANLGSTTGATQPQEKPLPCPPSNSHDGQTRNRTRTNASVSELRKEIRLLADQIADLRAQRLAPQVQRSPDGSPPGYTLSTNNLPDIPFFSDQKLPLSY